MENNRENLQVTRSQGQTSERQDLDQRIRQWLVKCGEVYGRQITPALVAIWVKGLEGMDGSMLENLFTRHLSTSRFFPVLADILAPQKEAAKLAVKQSAAMDWEKLLRYVQEWVHPDVVFSKTPRLPEKIERAARAAGGLLYLRECPEDDLQWARKRFVEAYERWEELESEQYLLPEGELKQLFAEAAKKLELPKLGPGLRVRG